MREIAKICDGPISAEVVGLAAEEMVHEGLEWAKVADNIVVKIPMTTEGLKAIRQRLVDRHTRRWRLVPIRRSHEAGV